MEKEDKINKQLFEEIEELRIRLNEAEETLSAIRSGEVDAIVVSGPQGDQVFTLTGAERAYRVLIETMNEGAVSLNQSGIIIYCNHRLSEMIKTPLEKVIGTSMRQFIRASDLPVFDSLIEKGAQENGKGEVAFLKKDGTMLPVLLSITALQRDNANISNIIVTDLTAQKHIEEELRRHRDNLEELVKDRTNELETSNQQLQEEIKERKCAEETLKESENREVREPEEVRVVREIPAELDDEEKKRRERDDTDEVFEYLHRAFEPRVGRGREALYVEARERVKRTIPAGAPGDSPRRGGAPPPGGDCPRSRAGNELSAVRRPAHSRWRPAAPIAPSLIA